MGGILATHLAQNRPEAVHGLLLFAPTLKLDGWSMPWYSRVLHYIRPLPIRFEFDLTEREPYGLKDERVRALVLSSMQSGDASLAGTFSTPLRCFANFNALVSVVKRELGDVRQPALIVHPRHDDMASLKNAHYLQTHLGGLVDTLVLDDSYHMVTLDQQRHLVAERTARFVSWLEGAIVAKGEIARDDQRYQCRVTAAPCRLLAADRPACRCRVRERIVVANWRKLASGPDHEEKMGQIEALEGLAERFARLNGAVLRARRGSPAAMSGLQRHIAVGRIDSHKSLYNHHTLDCRTGGGAAVSAPPAVACVGNRKSASAPAPGQNPVGDPRRDDVHVGIPQPVSRSDPARRDHGGHPVLDRAGCRAARASTWAPATSSSP